MLSSDLVDSDLNLKMATDWIISIFLKMGNNSSMGNGIFFLDTLLNKKKDQAGYIEKWSSVCLAVIFGNLNESALATSFKEVMKKNTHRKKKKNQKQKHKAKNKTYHHCRWWKINTTVLP